jgi:hypothetical protein
MFHIGDASQFIGGSSALRVDPRDLATDSRLADCRESAASGGAR